MRMVIVKLAAFITLFGLVMISYADAKANGTIRISGQPGEGQPNHALMYKCLIENVRSSNSGWQAIQNSCEDPITIEINKDVSVPQGNYLIGYSNTVYPGLYPIADYRRYNIYLQQVDTQGGVVTRDFGRNIEQIKLYFSEFLIGKRFFNLSEYQGRGVYLQQQHYPSLTKALNYSACEDKNIRKKSDEAELICEMRNTGLFMDMMHTFQFNREREIADLWVTKPGDIFPYEHKGGHLVTSPSHRPARVAVMPGAYLITRPDGTESKVETSGFPTQIHYGNTDVTKIDADKPSCKKASLWRTEFRSYCSLDSQEGCSRNRADLCEFID
jgi:hypothetical protein